MAYVQAINAHLSDPGLSAWIACRCAIEIVEGTTLSLLRRWPESREAIRAMKHAILELYDYGDGDDRHRWHHRSLLRYGMPLALRMTRGGRPIRLDQVVSESVLGRLSGDMRSLSRWLEEVPIPTLLIRPLVEAFRDDAVRLLRVVGDRGMGGVLYGPGLMVQDIQRILKICRNTDDPKVLRGASSVLATSAFAKIAEPELVVKMMSAGPGTLLVARVLHSARRSGARREVSSAERELSRAVARLIVDNPEGRPFRVVNRAVTYIADRNARGWTPLFEEYSDLLGVER